MRLSQELSEGIFDTLPLALGVAAYGFAFGIFAAQAGMTELQTGFMGAFVSQVHRNSSLLSVLLGVQALGLQFWPVCR